MDQCELVFVANIINGKEPLKENSLSSSCIYLSLVVFNESVQNKVRNFMRTNFDLLLRERLRQAIPMIIRSLYLTTTLCEIENKIYLIAKGCPTLGIPVEEYISMRDLGELRRNAHLRSAITAISELGGKLDQPAKMQIASAVLASISPEEIGISAEMAEQYINASFYRHNPDPILVKYWEAIEKRSTELNNLFVSSLPDSEDHSEDGGEA